MKRVLGVLALGAVVALWPADGWADGFAVNRFEPSERGSDFFANESLDLRGQLRLSAGVVTDWAYRPLALYDASGNLLSSLVRNQVVVHPGASLVLWDRLRVAADLPVQIFADGHGGFVNGVYYAGAASDPALGDARLGVDLRVVGEYRQLISLAIGTQVWLPTGDKASYSGDGNVRVGPRALVAGGVGPVQYAARLGFLYRGRGDTFAGSAVGDELTFAAGGGVRAFDDKMLFSGELVGSTGTDDPFKTRTTPFEGILGAHYLLPASLRVGGGVGVGLARGYGTPAVRGILDVEYAPQMKTRTTKPDRDQDGVPDDVDACPDVPGEKTSDPKTNGCPLRTDRDKDGILDDDDACPNAPGPATDNPRTNGCPSDRDGDGIIDPVDACPDQPGPEQADPKKTGCPPDSDGDGIIDEEDACPDVPGLKTDNPKTNGCPDQDRDKDGITNDQDACPDEAGKPDPDPKRNGCPMAFVQNGQIRILEQVKFKTGSAAILPGKDSEEVMGAVQKVLADHPEIKKVRIEGHTDNQGGAKFNKKLSADRAASVVKWLVAHGVAADRLGSEGFGSDRPIDSNTTDDGRKNNRRVEFHIEDATPPKPGP